MTNPIQYLKLWQKKRDELRVDTDASSDWLDMNALLDKHMPLNNDSGGSSPKKGISLFTTMLITLSAAAMFYVAHTVIETKKKAAYHKTKLHHKKHGSSSGADSLSISNSLQQSEDQIANGDSVSIAQNASATTGASDIGSNKNNGKSLIKADSANIRTTSPQLNGINKKETINALTSVTSGNQYHVPADKKRNLPAIGGKRRNTTQKNKQGYDLSSNSPHLLSKRDSRSGGDRNNNVLIKTSGNKPDILPGNSNRFNNNSSFTETNLNKPNRNQHYTRDNQTLLTLPVVKIIGVNPGLINIYPALNNMPITQSAISVSSKGPKSSVKSALHFNFRALDWGVLIGANSNGSFTSGNLNKNFYGSLPADVFTGIYGTYNLNAKWGIGAQVTLLNPQVVKGGTYDRPYFFSYTDSNAVIKHKLVTDSKKIYSIQLPVYATYKVARSTYIKAGPVISFPLKQYNITTQVDSISENIINHSHYDQKMDFGFAAGLNYQFKRLIFEVSYLKGLKQHYIVSDSLVHQTTNNTFQFSIKLQLGGNKK